MTLTALSLGLLINVQAFNKEWVCEEYSQGYYECVSGVEHRLMKSEENGNFIWTAPFTVGGIVGA